MENQQSQSFEDKKTDMVLTPEIRKRVVMAEGLYKNMSEDCARRYRSLAEATSNAVARMFVQNPHLSDLDLVSTT